MNFSRIGRLVIVSVVLVVVTLFLISSLNQVPIKKVTEEGPNVVFIKHNLPCIIGCLSRLESGDIGYLSSMRSVDYSPTLIEWFPCNNDLQVIAMLVNEMARWSDVNGVLVRADDYSFSKVESILYDCLSHPTNNKCVDNKLSFYYFCKNDTYLNDFGFIPCHSLNSFYDFISKEFFSYKYRKGEDISNDFVCTNGYYSLCSSDPASSFNDSLCRPSWITLTAQEQKESGRDASEGRCEDFSLLYYSLFRAIGVSSNDLVLSNEYCDLPCPCKQALSDYDFNYDVIDCIAQSNLTVKGYGTLSGCYDGMVGLPDNYGGEILVSGIVNGKSYLLRFNSGNFYRSLSFNSNFTDDINYYVDSGNQIKSIVYDLSDYAGTKILHTHNFVSVNINDLSNIRGKNGVFGFEFIVNALDDCDNVTLTIGMGGNSKSYVLGVGNSVGAFVKGEIGNMYYSVDGCNGFYTIVPGTMGLIVSDPCNNYQSSNVVQECDNYFISGYYYDNGVKHEISSVGEIS